MYLIIFILICMGLLFLFLYLRSKQEIKNLHNQLVYTNKEESTFTLYSLSSNKEMQEIIEEINCIKQSIENEKNVYFKNEKEIQDMIANISHDIRTPLTSIQGYVEMMQSNHDEEKQARYYQIVMSRLHDLERMLDEFFIYTKLMSSNETCDMQYMAPYPILCRALLHYMDELKNHQLEPIVKWEKEGFITMIHEESFYRVCMNLIMNTIRYGVAPFSITLQESSHQIIFENKVVNPQYIKVETLFDRFHKGSDARTQKGSGLGLAIVKELVHNMNGQVEAKLDGDLLQIIITFTH